MINLSFTENEMKLFLRERGYTFRIREGLIEENVYQNVFVSRPVVFFDAIKGNEVMSIEEAFKMELKIKLLINE